MQKVCVASESPNDVVDLLFSLDRLPNIFSYDHACKVGILLHKRRADMFPHLGKIHDQINPNELRSLRPNICDQPEYKSWDQVPDPQLLRNEDLVSPTTTTPDAALPPMFLHCANLIKRASPANVSPALVSRLMSEMLAPPAPLTTQGMEAQTFQNCFVNSTKDSHWSWAGVLHPNPCTNSSQEMVGIIPTSHLSNHIDHCRVNHSSAQFPGKLLHTTNFEVAEQKWSHRSSHIRSHTQMGPEMFVFAMRERAHRQNQQKNLLLHILPLLKMVKTLNDSDPGKKYGLKLDPWMKAQIVTGCLNEEDDGIAFVYY